MSGTKPDELIRTPMQWDGISGAGFTDGIPWQAFNSDFMSVNVEDQMTDETSLLEVYRTFIHLRNEHPALRVGQTYVLNSGHSKVAAYLRTVKDEVLLIVFNIDNAPVNNYDLDLDIAVSPLSGSYTAQSLLDDSTINPITVNDKGGFDGYSPLPELPPYSIIVVQLISQ